MNTLQHNTITCEFPAAFMPLFRPARYKTYYGGRGSAKSWSFARALVLKAAAKRLRVLCAREWQNSISESVHRLLADQIEALGLSDRYEVQQQGIYGVNGSEFLFVGVASNPLKLKSTEGVDICWVEEGQKVSATSWEILTPTIRASGSEIWISFNTDLLTDPTYQRFVLNPPPDCIVVKVNFDSNPWFPEELARERLYLQRVDPDAYANVWLGMPRQNSDAQIFKNKYTVQNFEPPTDGQEGWSGPFYGCDWGFSTDPSVLVRCWVAGAEYGVTQGKLMIEYEAYGVGVEIADTPRLFDQVPGARQHLIYADNSRPETISHVRNQGFRVESCEKWKGSVEDGVAYLRSFEKIVVHPRCVHTLQEMRLYSYKVDRLSGLVLPAIVDKDNHTIDGLRYALQNSIMSGSSLGTWIALGRD
jgi:phage terminase large subunit